MVDAGVTVVLVPTTVPTPLSMEISVAPSTSQERTLEPPAATAVGAAAKETMVGRLGRTTWTTSDAVVLPEAFDPVTV